MAIEPQDLQNLTPLNTQDLLEQAAETLGQMAPLTVEQPEGGVGPTEAALNRAEGGYTGDQLEDAACEAHVLGVNDPITEEDVDMAMEDRRVPCMCASCRINRGEISDSQAVILRAAINERARVEVVHAEMVEEADESAYWETNEGMTEPPPSRSGIITGIDPDYPEVSSAKMAIAEAYGLGGGNLAAAERLLRTESKARAEDANIQAAHYERAGANFDVEALRAKVAEIAGLDPDMLATGRMATSMEAEFIGDVLNKGSDPTTVIPKVETHTFGEEIYMRWGDIMTLIVDTLMVARHIPSLGAGSLPEVNEYDFTREELEEWVNDSLLMILNENGSIYGSHLLDKMHPIAHEPDPDYDLVNVQRHIADLENTLMGLESAESGTSDAINDFVGAVNQLQYAEQPDTFALSEGLEDARGIFDALKARVETLAQRGEQDAGAEPARQDAPGGAGAGTEAGGGGGGGVAVPEGDRGGEDSGGATDAANPVGPDLPF